MQDEDEVVTAIAGGETMTNKERRLARKAEKQSKQQISAENVSKKRSPDSEEELRRKDYEGAAAVDGSDEDEDIEALSHKERRKRRKLEKQSGHRTVDNEDSEQRMGTTTEERGTAKEKRSPFSLWVGNLSFQTSAPRLQQWFEEKGISGISRVHMPKGIRKMEYNRGFAYVDVPSADAMKDGIALSELNLDGRRLLIKAGSDYAGRPSIDAAARALAEAGVEGESVEGTEGQAQEIVAKKGKTGLTKTAQKILRSQKHPPGPTLFIGNLSFNATEEGVREMVERAAVLRSEGERASRSDDKENDEKKASAGSLRGAGIRKVRMGTFEDTGKCKGFTFVDFHTPAYATATLIDARCHTLDGRALILQYAGADAIRRGAVKGKMGAGNEPVGRRPDRRDRRPHPAVDFAALAESAPAPGSFDPEAPVEKRHKETREERALRRQKEDAADGGRKRRQKPGAALAQAQRGKTAIATDEPQGQKITFD
jgi:RNA recognition motif-containing protein